VLVGVLLLVGGGAALAVALWPAKKDPGAAGETAPEWRPRLITPGPGASDPQAAASGRQIFADHCARCHKVGSTGGGRLGSGPDLTRTGANPRHTVRWFSEYIRDPRASRSDSKMPPFNERKIPAAQLRALAEFLVSLR
jgi:mono/diheme cytochrome c family protein